MVPEAYASDGTVCSGGGGGGEGGWCSVESGQNWRGGTIKDMVLAANIEILSLTVRQHFMQKSL